MIKNNRVFLGKDFAFFTITKQDDGMRSYTSERYMSLLFKKYKSNALPFFFLRISVERRKSIFAVASIANKTT